MSCYIYLVVCHLVRSHHGQLKKQTKMALNPGTNVWGKIYRENREKSLAARKSAREDFNPTINLEETQTHFSASLKQTKPVSSCCDPEKRLDWSNLVDSVLKEEIGKMAEEFKNGMF